MPVISVVIPVYYCEACLYELYQRLKAALETISEDFEIIMVEDHGGDRSWDIISELAEKDSRVKGLQFSRNFGQHYGITAGIDYSSGAWVIVMDCDLQDRPEEIPRLYQKALEGYDVVLAIRNDREGGWRLFSSYLFYKVFKYLSGLDYDGRIGNFRIISRRVAEEFRGMREQLRFFGGMVDWLGFRTASIDVQHSARYEGRSTYTFRKLWRLAGDTIIAYSDKPLRFAIKIGFLISSCAFLAGGYIIYLALAQNVPVQGWSSLMVSLYFLGGIIIAVLGIMGIYIGKIFDETKKRPLYIIRKTTPNVER